MAFGACFRCAQCSKANLSWLMGYPIERPYPRKLKGLRFGDFQKQMQNSLAICPEGSHRTIVMAEASALGSEDMIFKNL